MSSVCNTPLNSTPVVDGLSVADYTEIAEVLAEAFRQDPSFAALFRSLAPDRDQSYRTFMQLWARSSFRQGHALYGVRSQGVLAGVVGVTDSKLRFLSELRGEWANLCALLWDMRLFAGLSLARATRRPRAVPETAAEITMLAVRPQMQGQKIATALLKAAHLSLTGRPHIGEVYLYTTAVKSKIFYERQGYKLVETARAAGVDVFHMLYFPGENKRNYQLAG